jgi:NADH-quinone oxidoreductase subunit N
MTPAALLPLLPMILLSAWGLGVLLLGAFGGGRRLVIWSAAAGCLAAAAASLWLLGGGTDPLAAPLLTLDGFTFLFTAVLALAGAAVLLFLLEEAREAGPDSEMLASLLLFSVLGGTVLVASRHFATFFLGLETLTVALYPLAALRRRDPFSLEAAVKYLVLASVSSGFLLFGAALIYAESGTLDLLRMAEWFAAADAGLAATAGAGLLFVGFGFKLAIVPFHLWTPDVYQGASTPISGFLASVSKGAVFLALLRILAHAAPAEESPWYAILYWLAVITMTAGNLLALFQMEMKRLLACSSIAHVGYLLMAPLALGAGGAAAGGFYVITYAAATLAAFGAVQLVASSEGLLQVDGAGLRGLAARRPLPAAALAVALFSLAGIPLTAGFMGKFFLFGAAVREGLYGLAVIAVVNSGISIYYYMRAVVAMYMTPADGSGAAHGGDFATAASWTLVILTALIILLGVWPSTIYRLVVTVAGALA